MSGIEDKKRLFIAVIEECLFWLDYSTILIYRGVMANSSREAEDIVNKWKQDLIDDGDLENEMMDDEDMLNIVRIIDLEDILKNKVHTSFMIQ